ncbi:MULTISPECIES: NADH-quinone oxidoreductase subunit A [Prolixibacter]|nr:MULTISPECIES: NADH-quinone oxidoreductase subunit A [Prolixibacter]PSK80396.1 NADH-quinone oxidoreductase subunit A [Prolixibacter denitrificans]GET25923.1 NADH-quinone oxidoreductase subunit A [Prolixibacter sp. NT017]
MGSVSILLLMFCGFAFAALAIGLGNKLSLKRYNPEKGEAYECGMETQGTTWVQFHVGYYLFALVFLLFDVEIAFLYPWAVVFKEIGMVAFIEIVFFVLVLFLGLLYAHKKKALSWM